MRKLLRNYLIRKDAATAIEFGIIAPVFFFLFLGIVEYGLTMFFDSSLNTGIRTAARQGVPQGFSNVGQVETILNNNLGGLYDKNRGKVIVLAFENFDDANFSVAKNSFMTDPAAFFNSTPVFPPQANQGGKIVLYGVRYEWGGITGMGKIFGNNPQAFIPRYLYSFAIVRNEEF